MGGRGRGLIFMEIYRGFLWIISVYNVSLFSLYIYISWICVYGFKFTVYRFSLDDFCVVG